MSFRVFEPSYDFIDERLNVFLGERLASVIGEVDGPLRIALLLYVVLYGVAILRGAISEPVMDFAVRSIKLAFLYALATTPAYSSFVTEPLFTSLPNALTRAVSGSETPSVFSLADLANERLGLDAGVAGVDLADLPDGHPDAGARAVVAMQVGLDGEGLGRLADDHEETAQVGVAGDVGPVVSERQSDQVLVGEA